MSRLSASRPEPVYQGIRGAMVDKGALLLVVGLLAQPLMAQTQRNPLLVVSPPASSEPASAAMISREVKDVFARAAHAVVKIHGVDEHSDIFGTGFFIDPTGTLYTANSVGGDAENFSVEFNGKKYPAKQVVADIRSGIAMLKIDAVTPALPIGKSQTLEVATPVVSISYPLDLPETPGFGL